MILDLREDGLREISKIHNLKLRQEKIKSLLFVAEQSVSRSMEELEGELFLLELALQEFRHLEKQIDSLERKIEEIFVGTDGAFLLTIPGLGLVTAAEVYRELGNIHQYESAHQLIKKAGTNPVVYQSGGKRGYYGKIAKQGNPHLRYILYLIGRLLSMHNHDLKEFYQRLKDKGKHSRCAYIAFGNKFIKIAYALLRDRKPYHSNQMSICVQQEVKKKLKYAQINDVTVIA